MIINIARSLSAAYVAVEFMHFYFTFLAIGLLHQHRFYIGEEGIGVQKHSSYTAVLNVTKSWLHHIRFI